jgi:hypothetical protein
MAILALPWIARPCFAAFYRSHVILAVITGIGAAFHGFGSAVAAGYVPMSLPGGAFWLIDIVIRICYTNSVSQSLRL